MLTELEEDLLFEVCLQSTKYKIIVERSSQSSVLLEDTFTNQDNSVS